MSLKLNIEPYSDVTSSDDGSRIIFRDRVVSFFGHQIPDFIQPNFDGVAKTVAAFYDELLFPNYDEMDDFGSLLESGSKSILTKQLDMEIPTKARVLELGCGSGQLSLFLSRFDRSIYGVDLSKGLLMLGEEFKIKHSRENVQFVRADVFDLPFKENYFDVIITRGALHHTENAKEAFFILNKYLKRGGVIVVGLYHKYGRLVTKMKQKIAPVLGKNIRYLDKNLRSSKNDFQKLAWERDQFFNPIESTHTIKETLGWVKELDMEFIKSTPLNFGANNLLLSNDANEYLPHSSLGLDFQELIFAVNPSQIRKGGFFVVSARKK